MSNTVRLFPSEIFYSQNSICNTFKDGSLLGEVLDNLCEGRMQKREFPKITVKRIQGKWITGDNRRLWVFRQLEKLHKCRRIPVEVIKHIPAEKMTSKNGGRHVRIRAGSPGGRWYRKVEDSDGSDTDSIHSDND